MTNEDRKLIFDYCEWPWDRPSFQPSQWTLNGNDILEAVKAMEEKGECINFELFCSNKKWEYDDDEHPISWMSYLLQNFFPLMVEWLKEKNKEKV
jgi:hypothetical protein